VDHRGPHHLRELQTDVTIVKEKNVKKSILVVLW
jgi:hypothetical protein